MIEYVLFHWHYPTIGGMINVKRGVRIGVMMTFMIVSVGDKCYDSYYEKCRID